MAKTVVVRYTVRPEAADENRRLVEAVYAELADGRPDGITYATFQLEDGVSFVHVAVIDADVDPLGSVAAFQEFQRDIAARVTDGPHASPATLVGSYGFAK